MIETFQNKISAIFAKRSHESESGDEKLAGYNLNDLKKCYTFILNDLATSLNISLNLSKSVDAVTLGKENHMSK